MTKEEALAKYLGIDVSPIRNDYDNSYTVDDTNEEYLILKNESEVFDYVKQDILDIVDDLGLKGSFTEYFYQWILDYAIDDDYMKNLYEEILTEYLDYREDEDSYSDFESDLVEYLYDRNYLTDDDFEKDENGECDHSQLLDSIDIDSLKQKYIDDEVDALDPENYEEMFEYIGLSFDEYLKNHSDEIEDIVDFDKVAEECIRFDGAGHFLAGYDGKEIELTDDDGNIEYYAYRTN